VRYEKLIWTLALVGVVFPGYFAIGLHQNPDTASHLNYRIDDWIPFCPKWMFAYGGVYTALLLPIFVVRDPALFRRTALAYFFTLICSYAFFLACPVTTKGFRPEVSTLDTRIFWQWGAALNYTIDPPMNSFPSLHVGTMTLATLISWRADKKVGYAAVVVAVIIALSTMLVKQHYLADVVAGAGLALVAYAIFIRGWSPGTKSELEIRMPRWCVLLYVGLYLLAIFGLLLPLYLLHVNPWESKKFGDVAPVSSAR
jgi:membrane-associated phospholipid phosphatase